MEEDLLADAAKEITVGLQLAEDLATIGVHTGDWMALAYAHLARTFLLEEKLATATAFIEKATSIQCDLIVKSRVLLTAGELAQKKKETTKAIEYYMDAINIIRDYQREDEHYDMRYRLGFAYLAGGKLEKAEAEFNALTSLTQQFSTIEALYGTYGLASVARAKGDIDTARRFAEEARDALSRSHTSHRLRMEIRVFLASLEPHR
jgi:tetratricopeptide (TPR) repeat protein